MTMLLGSLLLKAVRRDGRLERRVIEEIPLDMTKLGVVQVGWRKRLIEVTRSERTTLEKLGVTVPVAP